MTTMLNDFGAFLDSLRKSRNISREEFIDGIISIRQYQRYVNGESSLNNEKLYKLIDRTGMNYMTVHKLYIHRNSEQKSILNTIYESIIAENYVLAQELIKELSSDDFLDKYNKSFYELNKLILHRRTKTMSSNEIVDKLKTLINFPESMKNKIISFVEYVAYLDISDHSSNKDDEAKIVNFLYEKINEDNLATNSLYINYLPSSYSLVAKKLGAINEYQKSLDIAQKGIEFCIRINSLNSLAHLFYFKAMSLKLLDRQDEALIAAKKLFSLLYVEDKVHKTLNFTKRFENVFQMKVSDL